MALIEAGGARGSTPESAHLETTPMGELIAFKLPKTAMRPGRVGNQPGAILFFTGVRREIMREVAPPMSRSPIASPKDAESRGATDSGA